RAGVRLLEALTDHGERLGQRSRREDGHGAGHLPVRGLRARGVAAAARRHDGECRERGHAGANPAATHVLLPRAAPRLDRSPTTFVDLITATATEPTFRSNSSTASRLISDTTRKGSAWMSTCAITVSFTTAVTIPRSRLRAEESSDPMSGSAALLRTNSARSTSATTRRPWAL